ncbi:hypothetical protein BCR34DRAFT_607062 [Clohesyomyces aquaticus]|uniref:Uncharacterized protein n=1 Tax=Clohesyomyces aquaticus TaxID=1231657 RepID=A0A1Y1YJR5_9PLEO|nr:hypothetical protein BCR34DRAFT_607062 [Clohesyomyces aquaticus]
MDQNPSKDSGADSNRPGDEEKLEALYGVLHRAIAAPVPAAGGAATGAASTESSAAEAQEDKERVVPDGPREAALANPPSATSVGAAPAAGTAPFMAETQPTGRQYPFSGPLLGSAPAANSWPHGSGMQAVDGPQSAGRKWARSASRQGSPASQARSSSRGNDAYRAALAGIVKRRARQLGNQRARRQAYRNIMRQVEGSAVESRDDRARAMRRNRGIELSQRLMRFNQTELAGLVEEHDLDLVTGRFPNGATVTRGSIARLREAQDPTQPAGRMNVDGGDDS